MPTHAERQIVPYRPEQLFDLVADVGRYPEFLPWCAAARVRHRTPTELVADITVGFGPVRESFTSRDALERPGHIRVRYENGPFRYLNNQWDFIPHDQGCEVDFYIDFEFRSRILQAAIGVVFNEAVRRMVGAFHKRARDVYGPPPVTVPPVTAPPIGASPVCPPGGKPSPVRG
jgi:coenzyme Q-binding protein COQ10